MSKKGVVSVRLSKGFGNNLFQYVFGRLLAEFHDMHLSHKGIPSLGIKPCRIKRDKSLPKKIIFYNQRDPDTQYHEYFVQKMNPTNLSVCGFFEDYTLYENHLERIRSWFPKVHVTNTKDLVLHLRLDNRLIQKSSLKNQVPPKEYIKAFSLFTFDKLYIVTDCRSWRHITSKDVRKARSKRLREGYRSQFAKTEDTKTYFNNLVDSLAPFNPIIINNKKFINDFNFIRTFDNILFHNSTFSWWAATLSEASHVGVYRPWKPAKKQRNKNLGRTNFPGWFGWGGDI